MKVSIVIPTRNEEGSIAALLSHFNFASSTVNYEPTVVDDSTDKTAEIARGNGAVVIQGQGKGLGQAIIDGIQASTGDIVVVMDADLSHNPHDVPRFISKIIKEGYDLVIGSRYVPGGNVDEWSARRKLQSIIGVKLMQLVTGVKDSNSGFFAFRKEIVENVDLKADSWKILLEVLFKGNWISKTEIPIIFRDRVSGESKNSLRERVKHAQHLLKLLQGKFPRRYISYLVVGGIGATTYFTIFWAITEFAHIWYGFSYFIATMITIVQNYTLNHFTTFRKSRKLHHNHLKGLGIYIGGSWGGEAVEYCVMILLTEVFGIWYILSDLIGSGFGSIVKYTIFRKKIWNTQEEIRTSKSPDYEWHSFYKGLPWQKFWKRTIARVTKELAEPAGVMLDLGCGSSPLGSKIRCTEYHGVDPNQGKMEFLKSKLPLGHFSVGTSLDLHFPNGFFDTVLFIEAIEHLQSIEEVRKSLWEISRVTKPGGTVVIATPNYGSWTGKLQDRLYGIFQPSAYAEDHRIKFHPRLLDEYCIDVGLTPGLKRIPMKSDMVCRYTKR